MKAVIIGANGLIGSMLLEELLTSDKIERILVVHYRKLEFENSKIEFVQHDFADFENLRVDDQYDLGYCCLGTTRKKTPDLEQYKKIDVAYPVLFGKWFANQGGKHFSVVSAISADSSSSNYYNKFKGLLEDGIVALPIPSIAIMQPSLLLGNRQEKRIGEKIGIVLAPILNKVMFGSMKKYRAIEASKVSQAMFNASLSQKSKVKRYTWSEFSYF